MFALDYYIEQVFWKKGFVKFLISNFIYSHFICSQNWELAFRNFKRSSIKCFRFNIFNKRVIKFPQLFTTRTKWWRMNLWKCVNNFRIFDYFLEILWKKMDSLIFVGRNQNNVVVWRYFGLLYDFLFSIYHKQLIPNTLINQCFLGLGIHSLHLKIYQSTN